MAIVGTLTVLAGMNNAPLLAGVASSNAALRGMGATAVSTGAIVKSAMLGIGAIGVLGIGVVVNAAKDFEQQMATVNTIARLTPEALSGIGGEIRALSTATGATLPDLTASFYDLLSVGVPVGQAMEFLANATTLSIGGLSTSKEAVDAITTSINAWSGATGTANLTMEDSLKVTDLWAKGIELGGFKAPDIGPALAQVAPLASSMNTPLEEVAATMALLTTRGFTASTATTSMNAAFTALQRVPPGMEKLEKTTGKTYETIARNEGIHSAMMQVVADAEKFGVGLVDVFGRVDALGYVIGTTGTNAAAYEGILGQIYTPMGAAAVQAAIASATLDRQMAILVATANDLAITFGTALLPPLTSFVREVSGAVATVSAWAAANPQLSSSILPVMAGVGALALGVTTLNVVIGATALLLSPVGLLFIGIAAAIAYVIMNIDKLAVGVQVVNDKFREFIGLAQTIPGVELLGEINKNSGGNFEAAQEAYRLNHPELNLPPTGPPPGEVFLPPPTPFTGETFLPPGSRGAFGGGMARDRTIVQATHTTNVNVDGQKLATLVERFLYNDQTVSNSGFSTDDRNRH